MFVCFGHSEFCAWKEQQYVNANTVLEFYQIWILGSPQNGSLWIMLLKCLTPHDYHILEPVPRHGDPTDCHGVGSKKDCHAMKPAYQGKGIVPMARGWFPWI